MIRTTNFEKMGPVTQLVDLLSVGTREQITSIIRSNYEVIIRDIVPKLREFKDEIHSNADRMFRKSQQKLGKITALSPVWTSNTPMIEYANKVRHYLTRLPSVLVLNELHRLQSHVDMQIIDPSKAATKNMKYTVGEVFDYLNSGVRGTDSQLIVSDAKTNPFWVPFRYELSEGELANKIDLIWKEFSITKVIANFSKVFEIYNKLGDDDKEQRIRAVLVLLDFYRRILTLSFDPGFMKKFSRNPETSEFDQVGPMEAYTFANLDTIMNNFTRRITRGELGTIKALAVKDGQLTEY